MTLVTYARTFLPLLLFPLSLPAINSLVLYEVDGTTQSSRPTEFGRVFADSENIAQCPQAIVDGTPVGAGSWQADVKTRYASGNAKFAIITLNTSFTANPTSGSSHTVTFQNATCSNTPLSQAQMLAFNSGNWAAQMEIGVSGSSFNTSFENGTISDFCSPGTFNAGPPESCSGSNGGNTEPSGIASTTVVSSPVHSGTKALKLQISTPNTPTSGERMFRWLEPRAMQKGYYSVWINIPQRYVLTGNPVNGHFVNLFQFKTADGISRIDPIWALHINDDDPAHWYLQMIWGDGGFTGAGPHSGDPVSRKAYTQAIKELPVGSWVHLEAYLSQSNAFGGQLTVWQDGTQIFNFTSIKTSYNNCAYNSWCADDEWSVNLYSDGLTPNPAYIYVDDFHIYSVRVRAADMLGGTDPAGAPECGNNYWRSGPVVTTVVVQDCTSTTTYDFGWTWNGTTMASPVTGNASTASLHPIYVLSFYAAQNIVKVESILENTWTGRYQDQKYNFRLESGSPLTISFDHASTLFTHVGRTRWRKIGWSGTAPGKIRIDHNLAHLSSTGALPNYDLTRRASVTTSNPGNYAYSIANFIAGDRADICTTCATAGLGPATPWGGDYSQNGEGAILQREDLLYLYNMNASTSFDGSSCGTPNSQCASAWYMLTGESGTLDTTLPAISGGGAGTWNMITHVPYHTRESRSGSFYCAGRADKNASLGAACGSATGTATGRTFSRHAYPTDQNTPGSPPVAAVGTKTSGGWTYDIAHWLDYAYPAYLLTGDYFWLDEEYSAAGSILSFTSSTVRLFGSASFFSAFNVSANGYRSAAWPLQTVARVAYIAPDGTVEKTYFTSMLDSTLGVYEGILNITGTTLTPTAADTNGSITNSTCAGFTYSTPTSASTANRWNLGHCEWTQASLNSSIVPGINTLHNLGEIGCSSTGEVLSFFNTAVSKSNAPIWQRNQLGLALGHINELGFTEVLPTAQHIWKTPVEMVMDVAYNPFLVGSYKTPTAGVAQVCGNSNGAFSSNTYFQTWATTLTGYLSTVQAVNGFNSTQDAISGNTRCGDHGYSGIARAALTFAKNNTIVGACSQGACSANDAWTWGSANIPYFNTLAQPPSTNCSTSDFQIKLALAPRSTTPPNGMNGKVVISGEGVIR
jgi:hypothetical protein